MKRTISLLTAGALTIAPAIAMASPPSSAPAMRPSTTTTTTPGSAPAHTTGQPMQSCQTTGTPPGGSASAPGSAFNDSGKAGTKYAGTQPQNSKNSAAVSQYDVACANQPPK